MNELQENYTEKTFEEIKHINEFGEEYWSARELMRVLGYTKWENFSKVIDKAKTSCQLSGYEVLDHFPDIRKIVKAGITIKEVEDYHLTRYACYLIAQNGDAKKKSLPLLKPILQFKLENKN